MAGGKRRCSSIVICALTQVLAVGQVAAQSSSACPERTVRTLGALQSRIAALEAATRPTIAQRCELARLRLLTGRTDDAVTLLEGILRTQPRNVNALVVLARVHTREERDPQVVEVLQRALAIDPGHVDARVVWAEHVAQRRAPTEALPLFEKITADRPNDPEALVGHARVLYRLFRDSASHALVDRARVLDSLNVAAHLLKSELYLRALNEDARARSANHALALDSLSGAAHAAVGRILRQKNNVEAAYARLMAVLAFDPTNLETHNTLGNGGALKSWSRYPGLEDNAVTAVLGRQLAEADSLLMQRAYDRAETIYRSVLSSNAGLVAARLGLASVSYYRQDFNTSYQQFLEIARDYPGLGLAHYGVSQSVKRIRLLRDPRNAEALARFRALPRPEEPERLRAVFTDFDRLDEDLQKIVLLSVAPLSNYIPMLAIAGGSYHLLPFHHRLWQWNGTAGSRGRRTFDGRLWDDVKGQGGRNAVAGEEWTREVTVEWYNVLSHEFFHQVHAQLIPEQRTAISALYDNARRERKTLDSYADSNPQEYMAQAYEAFIHPIKDPRLGGTAGNTRARLRELDPAAFAFLEQINAQPTYRSHALLALLLRVNGRVFTPEQLEAAERESAWVLTRYGEHADIVAYQAGLARLRGHYARAAALHARAIALAPAEFPRYQELAEDYTLGWHDHARAADVMTQFLQRDSSAHHAWLALAHYRLAGGDLPAARRALERASALPMKAAGSNADEYLLRAEYARLNGDYSGAQRFYRLVVDSVNNRHVRARAELTLLALRAGDPLQADEWLQPVRDSLRNDPLAREAEARLLAAKANGADALNRLSQLRTAEPARLETITALIAVARTADPPQVDRLIADGRQIIERQAALSTVVVQNRFVGRAGVLTARARAEFEAEVQRK